MKNSFFLLISVFIIIFIFSCGKRLEEVNTYYDNGNTKETYYFDKDSLRFGKFQSFNLEGQIFEISNYNKGKLHGLRTIYYPNGEIEIEEEYVNGIYHGPYKSYYENGQLNIEAEYIDGKMEGLLKRYYETGELMEEVLFENNEENGPFKEYFKSGKTKFEGTYINGDNEVGIVKEYNENGELIKKLQCDKYRGKYICQTIWTIEEGDLELTLQFDE